MHRMYPMSKGDQLCPLGFHPQVRWPTRCKRCFRDYKEHGGKSRADEAVAASSPNISDASAISKSARSWTSTQNLSSADTNSNGDIELRKRPVSWNSTPDLDEKSASNSNKTSNDVNVSVKLQLPQRRHTTIIDAKELEESFSKDRPPVPPSRSSSASAVKDPSEDTVILKTDSLAERVRKMNLLKKQNSQEREASRERSRERSVPKKIEKEKSPIKEKSPVLVPTPPKPERDAKKRLSLPVEPVSIPKKEPEPSKKKEITLTKKTTLITTAANNHAETIKKDVQFLMQIKDKNMEKKKQDDLSSFTTDTTDTTIIAASDYHLKEEIKQLQDDLATMKTRAEKAEREKSDLLLRRLASLDTISNRTAASEALKLQEKVNELKNQVDELKEDKKSLNTKLRQLETKTIKSVEDDLRKKLKAAEQLCEELMDENNKVKKEMRTMEQEMDEIHDNFREDQASEYTNLKKEVEAQTKNCRILSFKLKKSERKIETLEQEKQQHSSIDLSNKIKILENDLKLANELSRRLQTELDQSKSPGIIKKMPTLATIGKSTSADSGRYTRASLTRGGSQEEPEQLRRDLQDSLEREADLKEQLKFAEEEAETIRKKATRMEDENESLMMQLKKMASRSRSRKLSPTPNRLTPEPPHERDEGISDEDDPAELRVLLELNEQESSILRLKVEDLENENKEIKIQIKELQDKVKTSSDSTSTKKSLSLLSSKNSNDKKVKQLEDELAQLKKNLTEKERTIINLQGEIAAVKKLQNTPSPATVDTNVDFKKQFEVVEQEAEFLRTKIIRIEKENEKFLLENKKLLIQCLRKTSTSKISTSVVNDTNDLGKLKEAIGLIEMERDLYKNRLQVMKLETENKLPPRSQKNPTEMITRPTLQKWVRELEDEIMDLRIMVWNSSAEKQNKLETEIENLEAELKSVQDELEEFRKSKIVTGPSEKEKELEQKYKKSDDECKAFTVRVKDLESKLKKLETQFTKTESSKSLLDAKLKYERDKTANLEKDLDKEKKEREKWEKRTSELDDELTSANKNLEKIKSTLEKEIKDLKGKVGAPKLDSSATSKQLIEMRKQNEDLLTNVAREIKKYSELNAKYENLSEENVLIKAQLAIEKKNLETEKQAIKQKLGDYDTIKVDKSELQKKLISAEKRIREIEQKNMKSTSMEYEKKMLKNTLEEKDVEYNRLKKENEMNIDLVFQLRKDNEDLLQKFKDYEKINKAQASMSSSNNNLEIEIKTLKIKLQNAELNTKSEIASTRLRYEQQIKNLGVEINAMQRQCERFKKDRDSFKQLLELAQKQIGELKHNTGSGRQSRSSRSSGDEDDLKGHIISLEQQIGCLEDQLSEARLDSSKYKNQLVSERTSNEIKISEMTSKINELEEDRLIATGRTKVAGIKTKLELSWQREREEQQRILQETSTLARDLRQTLFEVEREKDKERIESKRKLEQLKRTQEEEVEESRKKVSELQCDLLELRDAHAKLRTANEKLRRERERYEKELLRRRLEQDGDRKVGTLLQTVDELVKIAPDLKIATSQHNRLSSNANSNSLRPDSVRRSTSPSSSITADQISNVLARLAEASEELRRYQRMTEDEMERNRVRRGNLRRASSTENDGNNSATMPRAPGRLHRSQNGSLIRKSLSLDQANRTDQSIWRQDDGSLSSIQSIDSEMGGGLIRDSDLDSRLSGGSTQSDIPRAPRKKKRGLMGKLRSLTKSGRNAESEGSMQGSDSDVSMSSDIRNSKKDLRNRLSDMFRRSGSTSRGGSTEQVNETQRPVAVTVVGAEGDAPKYSPITNNVNSIKPITKSVTKPPTATTPVLRRKIAK